MGLSPEPESASVPEDTHFLIISFVDLISLIDLKHYLYNINVCYHKT